jgi:serine/threonine protein kinase
MGELGVLSAGKQILEGLQRLEFGQVLHRDLKPANVLLAPTAGSLSALCLKIADFGCATRIVPPVDEKQKSKWVYEDIGCFTTYAYAAPEILKRGRCLYSYGSDMWACAVILIEMHRRSSWVSLPTAPKDSIPSSIFFNEAAHRVEEAATNFLEASSGKGLFGESDNFGVAALVFDWLEEDYARRPLASMALNFLKANADFTEPLLPIADPRRRRLRTKRTANATPYRPDSQQKEGSAEQLAEEKLGRQSVGSLHSPMISLAVISFGAWVQNLNRFE